MKRRVKRSLIITLAAIAVPLAVRTDAQVAWPKMAVAPHGRNTYLLTITNGLPATSYALYWKPALGNANDSWTNVAIGTNGQTNFFFNSGRYSSGFFTGNYYGGGLDFNRYIWQNAAQKIAGGKTFMIENDGSGLVGLGILDNDWVNLRTNFNFAGLKGGVFDSPPGSGVAVFCYWGAFSNVGTGSKNTNWYTAYLLFTNTASSGQVWVSYPWNVLEIDYVANRFGGQYIIQTNNGEGGKFTTVTDRVAGVRKPVGFSAVSPTQVGRSFFWTNPFGPATMQVRVVQTVKGANILTGPGAWNTTLSHAFIVGSQSQPSSGAQWMLQVPTNSSGPIYAAWNPDIIFFEDYHSVPSDNPVNIETNFLHWMRFYTNWCRNAAVVVCGNYPTIGNSGTGGDQGYNHLLYTNVVNLAGQGRPFAYFDGFSRFGNTNLERAMGFWQGSPDYFIHFGPGGMSAYGSYLCKWVNLGQPSNQ